VSVSSVLAFWHSNEFFRLLVCIVLGALQVFAFAPFEVWPLSFVSLGVYFFLLQELNAKQAFRAGLAFGYGLYGVGVSWVYISLSTYGGMPLWMGSIAVLGFAGILALFIAAASALCVGIFSKKFTLLMMPFVWVIFEWLKSWVLTGFPWLDIGYTQTPTWFFSWAPIGGVYLVGFIVCLSSVLLVSCASAVFCNDKKAAFLYSASIVLLVVLSFGLDKLSWSQSIGRPITVGIIQANVPIEAKWQSDVRNDVLANYQGISHQLANSHGVELFVLPETAFPLYQQQTNADFWRNMTPPNTALLAGILDSPQSVDGHIEHSYNAAVLSCDGETQVYRKSHLVPFGEYLPLRFLFDWVLEYLSLPMSDMAPWSGQQSLACGEDIKVGLSICYEDAFAAEYRDSVGDATVLVNISEDAWFGDSFAPHQRRQMAQMRARELSRPMVRSANSGPSLFINERGEVLDASAQFVAATLVKDVQPHTGDSPFKRYGNWIVWLSIMLLLAFSFFSRRS